MENEYKGFPVVVAESQRDWREWLSANHQTCGSVWLVIYKKASERSSVRYSEAVDEALCFGWIDSLPNKRDQESYYQFFSPRSPKSKWSQVNKLKVAKLMKEGKMAPSGMAMVAIAKKTGTWDALNDVDNLVEPKELLEIFKSQTAVELGWRQLAPSLRRGLLERLLNARRPETQEKRLNEIKEIAMAKWLGKESKPE